MRPRSERPLQVNSVFRSQVVIGWISTSLPKGLDSPAGGLDNGLSSPVSCRPFSEQTADLPVPGNFPGNFREYSHCSKSPLIFKTRNLQGRCCGRGWISRGSKPVKALEKNQSVRPGGGKAGLESFSERSRPEREGDGARRRHGAYLAAAWRRSVSPAGRWKSLSGCRTSVTPAVAALLLLVVFVERVKRKDIDISMDASALDLSAEELSFLTLEEGGDGDDAGREEDTACRESESGAGEGRSDWSCPICLNEVPFVETAIVKGCNHLFCTTCILNWVLFKQESSGKSERARVSSRLRLRLRLLVFSFFSVP